MLESDKGGLVWESSKDAELCKMVSCPTNWSSYFQDQLGQVFPEITGTLGQELDEQKTD